MLIYIQKRPRAWLGTRDLQPLISLIFSDVVPFSLDTSHTEYFCFSKGMFLFVPLGSSTCCLPGCHLRCHLLSGGFLEGLTEFTVPSPCSQGTSYAVFLSLQSDSHTSLLRSGAIDHRRSPSGFPPRGVPPTLPCSAF